MEDRKIEFQADKVSIRGPNVDGGFKITFDVGEYEQSKLSEILKIPQNTIIRVVAEYDRP